MLEAKANEQSKPNIDVDMKILDSCCKLFAAIQVLINVGHGHPQNSFFWGGGAQCSVLFKVAQNNFYKSKICE